VKLITPRRKLLKHQQHLSKSHLKIHGIVKIKDNPEELDKLRQKRKEYYNKLKLRREALSPELKQEKKQTKKYIVTPREKHEYNVKYYSKNKEKVDNYIKSYREKKWLKRTLIL
jgi:predicted transcriptional regulator